MSSGNGMLQANTDFLSKFKNKISQVKKNGEHLTSSGLYIPPIFKLEQIPEEESEGNSNNQAWRQSKADNIIAEEEEEDDDSSYETNDEDDLLSARLAEETLQSAIRLLSPQDETSAQIVVNRMDRGLDGLKSWNDGSARAERSSAASLNQPVPPSLPKPDSAAPAFRRNRYSKLPKPIGSSGPSQMTIRSLPSNAFVPTRNEIHDEDDLPVIDGYSSRKSTMRRAETEHSSNHTISMKYQHVDSYTEKMALKEKEMFEMIKNDLKRKQFAEKIRQENRLNNALRAAQLLPPRVDPFEIRKQKENEKLSRRLEYGNKVRLPPMKDKSPVKDHHQTIRQNNIQESTSEADFEQLERKYLEKKRQVDEIRNHFSIYS